MSTLKAKLAEETAELPENFTFYGTLRPGGRNFPLVDVPGTEVVRREVTLPGFKMYSTRYNFPYIVFTGDPKDTIVVDLVKVPDKRAAASVHWMEIGAGYHAQEVEVDGITYWIYAYDDKTHKQVQNARFGSEPIEAGDWLKYLEATAAKSVGPRWTTPVKGT